MVDKISTEYEITQQQRTRSHRRERRSASSLAPTPEVAQTRHASPATLWCLRINVGLCLPLPSIAHSDQCLLCAAVVVVFSSFGRWGKIKHNLTTLPRISYASCVDLTHSSCFRNPTLAGAVVPGVGMPIV